MPSLYFLLCTKVSWDVIDMLNAYLDVHLDAQRVMRRVFILLVVPFERSVMTYASVSREQILSGSKLLPSTIVSVGNSSIKHLLSLESR